MLKYNIQAAQQGINFMSRQQIYKKQKIETRKGERKQWQHKLNL